MSDSLLLLEKQKSILQDNITDDEASLVFLEKKHRSRIRTAFFCSIFAAVLLACYFFVPSFVSKENSKYNPLMEVMLAAASLVELSKFFILLGGIILLLLGIVQFVRSRVCVDNITGIQAGFDEVYKLIEDRICRNRKEIKELDEKIMALNKAKEEKKKKMSAKDGSQKQPDVLQPDFSRVMKNEEGQYYMKLEDVWQEILEDEEVAEKD